MARCPADENIFTWPDPAMTLKQRTGAKTSGGNDMPPAGLFPAGVGPGEPHAKWTGMEPVLEIGTQQ
ncbi:hypothetical protein HNQ79_005419 [Streptomyces candidus]|uniref:Uncharacterized protein n=1 Tax=Streptomyces candidus TaxID=67283 RepID=A0A7X0HM52_9ACTN|nr:hypothetical protein [Streptomyces candidus]GHH52510.1 hypothetical protein GCM10018773_52630 [Streptomyces candidus]